MTDMSSVFYVYDVHYIRVGGEYLTLEGARSMDTPRGARPAFIQEVATDPVQGLVQSFFRSFFPPPPEPRSSSIWPEDITQSLAWKHCANHVQKEVRVTALLQLVGQQLSQLHEPVLEDYCCGVARGAYSDNVDFWASSLPAGPDVSSDEAERCIVDELEGLARRELRSALAQLSADIESAIALIDKME